MRPYANIFTMRPISHGWPTGWYTAMAILVLLYSGGSQVVSGQLFGNRTQSDVMFLTNNTIKIIAFSDGGT